MHVSHLRIRTDYGCEFCVFSGILRLGGDYGRAFYECSNQRAFRDIIGLRKPVIESFLNIDADVVVAGARRHVYKRKQFFGILWHDTTLRNRNNFGESDSQ